MEQAETQLDGSQKRSRLDGDEESAGREKRPKPTLGEDEAEEGELLNPSSSPASPAEDGKQKEKKEKARTARLRICSWFFLTIV